MPHVHWGRLAQVHPERGRHRWMKTETCSGEEKLRCEPLRLTALSGHTHPAASNIVIEGS